MPQFTEKSEYDCTQLNRINNTPNLCCQGCHRPEGGWYGVRLFNGIEVKVCCSHAGDLPEPPPEIEGQSPDYPMPTPAEAEHARDCDCLLCEEDDDEDDEDGPY